MSYSVEASYPPLEYRSHYQQGLPPEREDQWKGVILRGSEKFWIRNHTTRGFSPVICRILSPKNQFDFPSTEARTHHWPPTPTPPNAPHPHTHTHYPEPLHSFISSSSHRKHFAAQARSPFSWSFMWYRSIMDLISNILCLSKDNPWYFVEIENTPQIFPHCDRKSEINVVRNQK